MRYMYKTSWMGVISMLLGGVLGFIFLHFLYIYEELYKKFTAAAALIQAILFPSAHATQFNIIGVDRALGTFLKLLQPICHRKTFTLLPQQNTERFSHEPRFGFN